jgi:23S rRNA (adenine2030-N6)-methyltransferase
MKYRHSFHAGNFADVHKHVTLLALLRALQRKDKGLLYLETHAGRGAYDLAAATGSDAAAGVERVLGAAPAVAELADYTAVVRAHREATGAAHGYPGSPLIAASVLRAQDRAVFVELRAAEAAALSRALPGLLRRHVETGDGFDRLRAFLPPPERRGLLLIDPPYEQTRADFERVDAALQEALRRFATGVIAAWYPIKDARDSTSWQAALGARRTHAVLASELWLHVPDSRIALNGSGVLIVNPPFGCEQRMREWLPNLHALLDPDARGGTSVRMLGGKTP